MTIFTQCLTPEEMGNLAGRRGARLGRLAECLHELAVVQLVVEAALLHQLLVVPLLDDGPVVHHQDGVRPPNGREAVGDDEAGSARISPAIACWMSTSVRVSTELVASSRMRICGSAMTAGRW